MGSDSFFWLLAVTVIVLLAAFVTAMAIPGDTMQAILPGVILFSVVFVVVGFMRGVRAEAWSTTFILIAFILLHLAGDTLITWTNRIYKLSRFALAGGIIAENPVEMWQKFADKPPLIETDVEQLLFRMGLFLGLYLLGLIIGRLSVQRALMPVSLQLVRKLPDLGERLMGAVVGGVNGFLIAFFVLPQVLPAGIALGIPIRLNTAIAIGVGIRALNGLIKLHETIELFDRLKKAFRNLGGRRKSAVGGGLEKLETGKTANNQTATWMEWSDMPLLLTTKDAAKVLRVHTSTISHWCRRGKLPASKIGGSWRIKREDVLALLDTEPDSEDNNAA